MKRMLLVLTMVIAGYATKAQDTSKAHDMDMSKNQDMSKSQDKSKMQSIGGEKVPAKVCSAVIQKYPGLEADNIDWTKQGNKYKAEFTKDNKDYEVKVDQNGKLISSEAKIEEDQLPQEVKQAFEKSEFSTWNIKDVEEKEDPQGKTSYQLELEKGNQSCEVRFDSNGNMIKKSKG